MRAFFKSKLGKETTCYNYLICNRIIFVSADCYIGSLYDLRQFGCRFFNVVTENFDRISKTVNFRNVRFCKFERQLRTAALQGVSQRYDRFRQPAPCNHSRDHTKQNGNQRRNNCHHRHLV